MEGVNIYILCTRFACIFKYLFNTSSYEHMRRNWREGYGAAAPNCPPQLHHCLKSEQCKQVRRVLGQDVTASLVSALVLSKLDYCNAVYAGLPKSSIAPLQRVQNAAARLVLKLGPRDHVTPAFHQLHWLPVEFRIQNKLCLIIHHLHVGHDQSCLKELVHPLQICPVEAVYCSENAQMYYELPLLNLTY